MSESERNGRDLDPILLTQQIGGSV